MDYKVFELESEKANLLAVLSGKGERPTLRFGPSYVDVVPVENPESWTHPPFSGVITDSCVWGRGAFDTSFTVACQTVVHAHLCEEGFRSRGDLKLLIVFAIIKLAKTIIKLSEYLAPATVEYISKLVKDLPFGRFLQ